MPSSSSRGSRVRRRSGSSGSGSGKSSSSSSKINGGACLKGESEEVDVVLIDPDADATEIDHPFRPLAVFSKISKEAGPNQEEAYILAHEIEVYAQDIFAEAEQASSHRRAASADCLSRTAARALICSYFETVAAGRHVVGRSFAFIAATAYNRVCFVKNASAAFRSCGELETSTTLETYQNLLCLLCPDFPLGVVLEAATAISDETELTARYSLSRSRYPFKRLHTAVMLWYFFRPAFSAFLRAFRATSAVQGGGEGVGIIDRLGDDAAVHRNNSMLAATDWGLDADAVKLTRALRQLYSAESSLVRRAQMRCIPLHLPPWKLVERALSSSLVRDDDGGKSTSGETVAYKSFCSHLLGGGALWTAVNQYKLKRGSSTFDI